MNPPISQEKKWQLLLNCDSNWNGPKNGARVFPHSTSQEFVGVAKLTTISSDSAE